MLKLRIAGRFTPRTQADLSSFAQADCLGALAIAAYVIFLPWDSQPDLSTLGLLILGLIAINFRSDRSFSLQRIDIVVIASAVITVIVSAALSDEPARSFRYVVYLCLNMFLLLLASGLRSTVAIRIVTGTLGLVGIFHLASLLLTFQDAHPGGASSMVRQVFLNTMIVPNDALILGLCLPSLVFFLQNKKSGSKRLAYVVAGLYSALAIYASYRLQSKISVLSVGSALLILIAARVHWTAHAAARKSPMLALVGIFGALAIFSASAWYMGNQSTTRLSLWVAAGSAHENVSDVLFGAGPNTFRYDPAGADSAFDKGDLVIPWAHNLFLEAYNEQGLAGLLVILAMTLIPVLRSLRIEDSAIRSLIMASTITIFLLSIFEITLTRRFYFAFLAIMYGITVAHTKRTDS